jgi:hypothetical protein
MPVDYLCVPISAKLAEYPDIDLSGSRLREDLDATGMVGWVGIGDKVAPTTGI